MQTFKLILFSFILTGILLLIVKFVPAFHNVSLIFPGKITNKFAKPIHQEHAKASFIKTDGTTFVLDGKNFPIIGVNNYDLAYQSDDVIDQTFATLQKVGVTTVRFWLFGDGNTEGFQPQPGQFSETRFKQADYVFYAAEKYHIKLIPTLVNNWNDYGGKEQYLKWVGRDPSEETSFYTDPNIRALFENYLSYVFARKNSYTQKLYSEDPTILGWDIMNEPRSSDNAAMNAWLSAVASDIKAHDPNHLVFAGTERATGTLNNEGKSSSLCESYSIDVCSVHLYLFHEQQPLFHSYDDLKNYLHTQKDYANSTNKPILLEEFGIATDTRPFGQDQLPVMEQILKMSQADGYAGFLIWDWANDAKSPFTFSPQGNGGMSYSIADLEKLFQ